MFEKEMSLMDDSGMPFDYTQGDSLGTDGVVSMEEALRINKELTLKKKQHKTTAK